MSAGDCEVDAAHKEAAEVLRLKPDFAYADEARIWNTPDAAVAHMAEGVRRRDYQ
jgi:hypothetical protein